MEKSESMAPPQLQRSIFAPCITQGEQPVVGPIHRNLQEDCAIKFPDPNTSKDLTNTVLKPTKWQHFDKRGERCLVSSEDQEKVEANANANVASQVKCFLLTFRFHNLDGDNETSDNVHLNYLDNVCKKYK